MARADQGSWSFVEARLTYMPRRREGRIVGYTLRVYLMRQYKLPMSKREALVISAAIHPGALFILDQKGKPDWVALRALEVMA